MSVPRPPPPRPPPRPAPEVPTCTDLDRLHDDCRRGHASSVYDAIGASPALVNAKGNLDYTALMWAAQTGHTAIVEMLLHAGADVNAQNMNGDTALHLASFKNHSLVVSALLNEKFQARLDIKNRDGVTAEQLARCDAVRDAFAKPAANMIQMAVEEDDDSDDDD